LLCLESNEGLPEGSTEALLERTLRANGVPPSVADHEAVIDEDMFVRLVDHLRLFDQGAFGFDSVVPLFSKSSVSPRPLPLWAGHDNGRAAEVSMTAANFGVDVKRLACNKGIDRKWRNAVSASVSGRHILMHLGEAPHVDHWEPSPRQKFGQRAMKSALPRQLKPLRPLSLTARAGDSHHADGRHSASSKFRIQPAAFGWRLGTPRKESQLPPHRLQFPQM
jgi:hypothetical protein